MDKKKQIEEFLKSLGKVEGEGFTKICNACNSINVGTFDDSGCGTEYTGCWGGGGLKCKDCGNSEELYEM